MGRARLGVLAPAALSVCMDASVLAVPAAGAIVSTVLKELSKAFMLKKWFHGDLSAKEAEQLMMQRGKNGSFLVRESRGSPGDFVLSVRVRGRVSHVVIRKQHNKYEVGSGEQFDDLAGLIEHFRNYPMVENSGDVLRLLQPLSFTRLRVCDIDARVDHLKNQKENAENEKCRESFQREFESLCEVNNLQHLTTVEGDKPENINKNRYRNVIPYDRTRVVLHSDGSELELGSDYINANFIRVTAGQDSVQSSIESIDGIYLPKSDSKRPPIFVTKSLTDDGLLDLKKSMALEKFHVDNVDGGTVGDKVYIATQGCLPNTENDFWRMIWQEDVRVIAMITKEVEKGKRKCERYWPELNEETTYACHTVRHVSEYHQADYILREFNVRNAHGTTRAVYQYQFTGWPDHGTPADARAVLTFIADINLKLKQIMHSKDNPENAVLCVHCSAGVGRTGTFIVLDMIIDKIRNKGMHCNIDIHGAVKTVRGQRSGMVQNESQYKFIYLAVQEYVDGGRKPDVEVNSHYRAKLSHCTIGHQN